MNYFFPSDPEEKLTAENAEKRREESLWLCFSRRSSAPSAVKLIFSLIAAVLAILYLHEPGLFDFGFSRTQW
jgi:hypothetical protein